MGVAATDARVLRLYLLRLFRLGHGDYSFCNLRHILANDAALRQRRAQHHNQPGKFGRDCDFHSFWVDPLAASPDHDVGGRDRGICCGAYCQTLTSSVGEDGDIDLGRGADLVGVLSLSLKQKKVRPTLRRSCMALSSTPPTAIKSL